MLQMGDAYLGLLPWCHKNGSDLATTQSFARTRNRRSESSLARVATRPRRWPSPVRAGGPEPLKWICLLPLVRLRDSDGGVQY
jgi:hypothetical protein